MTSTFLEYSPVAEEFGWTGKGPIHLRFWTAFSWCLIQLLL